MIGNLWNLGLKVHDLDREITFLQAVGADLVLRERLPFGERELDYALMTLGGVRLLLFPTVAFEDRVAGGVAPGLTHAVFEVDDLEAEVARLLMLGAEMLIEPTLVSAGFGSRRLAFFRSPGGLIFEVMQIREGRF